MHLKNVIPGGAGGAMAPQILADQLTQSQPGGADYAPPPDFQTFLRPRCVLYTSAVW